MPEQDLDYVEQMYRSADDPWRISTGRYEERKREILLACLPERRYQRIFEPGCAAGELTAQLIRRGEHVVAADVSERAVKLAQDRVPSADVRCLHTPQAWPEGRFDLIVLSEFGYYLPAEHWRLLIQRTVESLAEPWTVIACHWKHAFDRRLNETDWLHDELAAALPGRTVTRLEDEDFRLDVWSSVTPSLAERDDR